MKIIFAAAIAVAGITGTALAGDADAPKVTTDTPTMMTDNQMDKIVAGNHVIRLVLLRTGLSELSAAATEATTAAGSIDGAGQDRPAIVAILNR